MAKYEAYRVSIWREIDGTCPMCGFVEGESIIDFTIHSSMDVKAMEDIIFSMFDHANAVITVTTEVLRGER